MEVMIVQSTSMEKTVLKGDVIIINKFSTGGRFPRRILPQDWASFFSSSTPKIYEQLPYFRMPSKAQLKQSDLIVFNYPGDTSTAVDKRVHFLKRISGMPGDTLRSKNGKLQINGTAVHFPALGQKSYKVPDPRKILTDSVLMAYEISEGGLISGTATYVLHLAQWQLDSLKKIQGLLPIRANEDFSKQTPDNSFIHHIHPQWTFDNFGPLVVPLKNKPIRIHKDNYFVYEDAIRNHEYKTPELRNDSVFINGEHVTDYRFKMNYYFVTGDNYHNSSDSRMWGFVPENHIIGKVSYTLFSFKTQAPWHKSLRVSRCFKSLN